MADVSQQLVANSYIATKRPKYATEVVRTDGGGAHHNSRWASPLAQWDVTIPFCKRTDPRYLAAIALFDAALGSGLTFIFHDSVACEDVEAWILDDTLAITPNGNLVQVEFSVEEYRASGNSPP